LRFKVANPKHIIKEQTFERLKPIFVKPMQKRNTCCCIYHIEMEELRLGLNNMKVKSSLHHSDECECQCSYVSLHSNQYACGASSKAYKGTTNMWQMIVCEKLEEEEWHKKKCLYGQCISYSLDKFPFCSE
jgi:hypothetical protein